MGFYTEAFRLSYSWAANVRLKSRVGMLFITIDSLLKFIVAIAVVLFFFATAFISFDVKIVPENKRIVLFRTGKSLGARGPGIVTVLYSFLIGDADANRWAVLRDISML